MSYQINSTVNKEEAEILKDIIFKRVKERTQAMTSDVQADIMDIARESFVANNNPFSQIVQNMAENTNTQTAKENEQNSSSEQNIGFPQQRIQIQRANNIANEQAVINTINNNMIEARASLSQKPSFMGALNFLNSHSAVSMFRDKDNNFDAIA